MEPCITLFLFVLQQGMNKREIEDLLRRGAYGAVMDDDNDAGAK